jgi:hypothetical protein
MSDNNHKIIGYLTFIQQNGCELAGQKDENILNFWQDGGKNYELYN